MLKIKSDVLNIQKLWDEVQIEQSEKLRLENSIHSFLGFSGMIHKLKDAILIENWDQLASIKSDIHSAKTIIQLYLSLQLSNAERYALDDILAVLEEYQQKTELLPSLLQQNIAKYKLDQFMRIDDKPAFRGLEIINQYNRNLIAYKTKNHSKHTDKFTLLTNLVAQLGYGGLIHHIKNLEIRSDHYYAIASQKKLNEIKTTLKKFQNMLLTRQEKKAIADLINMTNTYQIKLNNLKLPIKQQEKSIALTTINETQNAF